MHKIKQSLKNTVCDDPIMCRNGLMKHLLFSTKAFISLLSEVSVEGKQERTNIHLH